MTADQPATPKPKLRWYHLTPGRLLVVLLIVEGFLLLSERFQWFSFNEKKGWTVLIAVGVVGVFLLLMLFWFLVSLIFRWHFQFSIRWLLVLAIAVAIPSSWLAVEITRARGQKEAIEALKQFDSNVQYDDGSFDLNGPIAQHEPALLREMLGNNFFRKLKFLGIHDRDITDVDLKYLVAVHGKSV